MRIDLSSEIGIVAPKNTGILEDMIREIGRRGKKLGWNWKDHGITQQASTILLRRYSKNSGTNAGSKLWGPKVAVRVESQDLNVSLESLNYGTKPIFYSGVLSSWNEYLF